MKKIYLTVIFILVISLCACQREAESVGIIGGADGPTAILVTQNFPIMLPVIVISVIAVITIAVLIIHNFNKKD